MVVSTVKLVVKYSQNGGAIASPVKLPDTPFTNSHWVRFIVSPRKTDSDKRQLKQDVPVRAVVIELGKHFALNEPDLVVIAIPEQASV